MTILERFLAISMGVLLTLNCFQYLHASELKWQLNRANEQIADLSEKITTQNNAIRVLKNTSDIQAKNIINAEAKAAIIRRQADNNLMDFMKTPVSSQCINAIAWGSVQGVILASSWNQL